MRILVTDGMDKTALETLRAKGHEVVEQFYAPEELGEAIRDFDVVVVRSATKVRANHIDAAKGSRLKLIIRAGVGVDNIAVKYAEEHGIQVKNTPRASSNAVAELGVAMILNCLRSIPQLNQKLDQGEWARAVGKEILGKTVGILGFGDIGGRVAKKLSGMGVELLAYDPYPNEAKARDLHVTLTDMDTVLAKSDVISIHMPSIPATRHIMDRAAFAKMKQGAYFINTARGALVDTQALIDAVTGGHLAGAALDVYEQEPLPMDAPILHTPGIQCTPHTGAETVETYHNISMMAAQAVIDSLNGKEPKNWINR